MRTRGTSMTRRSHSILVPEKWEPEEHPWPEEAIPPWYLSNENQRNIHDQKPFHPGTWVMRTRGTSMTPEEAILHWYLSNENQRNIHDPRRSHSTLVPEKWEPEEHPWPEEAILSWYLSNENQRNIHDQKKPFYTGTWEMRTRGTSMTRRSHSTLVPEKWEPEEHPWPEEAILHWYLSNENQRNIHDPRRSHSILVPE